jgi:protein involved in polysaccharide export with SLBB domain
MERINMNKRAYDLCLAFLLGVGFFTACKSSDSHFSPVGESSGLASSVQASLNGHYADVPEPQNPPPGGMTKVALNHQFDPAWLKPSPDLFTLGPGDRVEIELLGEPGSRATTVVAPDGKIYFNLLPGIDVWGKTIPQAKTDLENELAKYVRERPQLSVILRGVESRRVWVLGRVQAPGVYPMTAPMTLLEGISLAGGTLALANFSDQEAAGVNEQLADLKHSFLIRRGKMLPVDFQRLLNGGDVGQNVYLEPDDFIYLPAARAREIYVLGAVAQPRPVPFKEGMTVASAVASGYGTIKGAYMHHVTLIRGSLSQPEVAVVDYKAVIRGEARDVALQPGDIVYVPFSPYRYLTKYVELAINTFVSSAAINAGERAVSKVPVGGAGVFIPVGSGVSVIPPVSPPPVK